MSVDVIRVPKARVPRSWGEGGGWGAPSKRFGKIAFLVSDHNDDSTFKMLAEFQSIALLQNC